MILDNNLMFSEDQAVTASAVSTNVIDIGATRDIGVGTDMYLISICTVAMTDASSDSTITVTLRSDGSLNGGALTSANTLLTLGTFAATSAIGTRLITKLPPGLNYERYLDVYYTAANGNLSTGSFTTMLVKDAQLDAVYPGGFTVQ